MTRKLYREVAQIVKRLQSIGEQAVAVYEPGVDQILDSSCREKNRIERILDGMLGFCFDKDMLLLYKRLCRHYYGIDRDAATRYVYAYRDMWDSKESQRGHNRNQEAVKRCR